MVRLRTLLTAGLYSLAVALALFTFMEISLLNQSRYKMAKEQKFNHAEMEITARLETYAHFTQSLYAFYNSADHITTTEMKTFYQSWDDSEEKGLSQYLSYYGWINPSKKDDTFLFSKDGEIIKTVPEFLEKKKSGSLLYFTKDTRKSGRVIVVAIDKDPFLSSLSSYIRNISSSLHILENGTSPSRKILKKKTFEVGNSKINLVYEEKIWAPLNADNITAFLAALAVFFGMSYISMAYRRSEKKAIHYESEKNTALRQLDEQNFFLNQMIENIPGIVFVKDASDEYKFRIVNKAAEEIFGHTRQDMIGKSDYDFFKTSEADYFRNIDESIMKSRRKLEIPCESLTTKRGEILCHTRKVPIYDADGSPKFLIGLSEDITERKKNELELADYRKNLEQMVDERTERLKQAIMKAEESNRLKSEFLATMSHEIRSPMSGVLGMAELLLDTPLTAEQNNLTRTILNSGEILMNIIEDILDFSKIEANKLDLDPVPVNMLDIVDDIGFLYSSKARDKALEIAIRYVPGTEQFVYADPVRIRQILGNIVNNAIKFTEKGYITIVVQEYETSPPDSETVNLVFSVEDSGIGIEEKNKEKIFGKFSQANSSTTRQYGGTGLGLSICKKLVELMGGTISFESEVGKGSIFEFSLPLKRNRQEYLESFTAPALKNVRVLIVDDLDIVRTTLEEQLEHAGMICTIVSNAHEALETLNHAADEKTSFDMAIVDYLMPDMNGENLAKIIKSTEKLQDICLIMLTAAGTTSPVNQSTQSSFSAFLSKPVRTAQLVETLSFIWEKYKQGVRHNIIRIDNQPIQLSPNAGNIRLVHGARILLVEDSRLNQAFAEEVLNQIECDVTIASNGQEALDVLQRRPFDLVLMDCQMPVMDGFEASRHIQRLKENGTVPKDMPVIALTANAMKGDRQKCLDSGMDDYITKPVRKQELKDKIYEWISLKETNQPNNNAPLLDQAAYDEARILMKDKFDDLMSCYIEDVEAYIREMHDALSRKDMQAMILPAHTIKSTSKRMGAVYLSEIAKSIELFAKEAANNNQAVINGGIEENLHELSVVFERTREEMTARRAG